MPNIYSVIADGKPIARHTDFAAAVNAATPGTEIRFRSECGFTHGWLSFEDLHLFTLEPSHTQWSCLIKGPQTFETLFHTPHFVDYDPTITHDDGSTYINTGWHTGRYLSFRIFETEFLQSVIKTRIPTEYGYFYELIVTDDVFKLYVKYETIVGGRLLCELSRDSINPVLIQMLGDYHENDRNKKAKRASTATTTTQREQQAPTLQAELALLTASATTITLPSQHLSHYQHISYMLKRAGGKYRANAFHFTRDAQQILAAVLEGNTPNPKQEYQFFETPPDLARRLVDLARIEPHHACLEPSAGRAAIANPILEKSTNLVTVELMPENARKLQEDGFTVIEADFLTLELEPADRIIANPPFTKNADILHVRKMFDTLKPGGRLVSIMSTHWHTSDRTTHRHFRSWLEEQGASIEHLPPGTFKTSGTNVATTIVTIDKPL